MTTKARMEELLSEAHHEIEYLNNILQKEREDRAAEYNFSISVAETLRQEKNDLLLTVARKDEELFTLGKKMEDDRDRWIEKLADKTFDILILKAKLYDMMTKEALENKSV